MLSKRRWEPAALGPCLGLRNLCQGPAHCLPRSRLRWAFVNGHAPPSPRNFECAFLYLKTYFADFFREATLDSPRPAQCFLYTCLSPHPRPHPYACPCSRLTSVHISVRTRISMPTSPSLCLCPALYLHSSLVHIQVCYHLTNYCLPR